MVNHLATQSRKANRFASVGRKTARWA